MLAIMVIGAAAVAIVMFAIRIVAGWVSPAAGARVARAFDRGSRFVLKLTVVALAALILAAVGASIAHL
jgi:hypothetical protein